MCAQGSNSCYDNRRGHHGYKRGYLPVRLNAGSQFDWRWLLMSVKKEREKNMRGADISGVESGAYHK